MSKAAILVACIVMVVIRAPHGRRSRQVKVARSYKDRVETVLLTLVWIGFLVPVIWALSGVFSFADYALRPWPFTLGACASRRAVGRASLLT